MPTYYLIPYRNGMKIGEEEDIYPLLLDDDKERAIYPEKLKQWMVEIHCGNTGMKCVACQKYIHDNIKFASLSLYFMYNADTNILSHNTNYHPFTGLSYRNNDDEDLIILDKHFELHLQEGMFLSFNLSANHARRFCYPMDFYVGTFEEEEEEGIDSDIDVDEKEDDEPPPPQLLDLPPVSIQPSLGPRTPCNVQEASRNPIDEDDHPVIVSMTVAVQPSLDARPPPPIPEDARVPIIDIDDNGVDALATPHRMPDPPGSTPINFSSPLPVRLCSQHMFSMLSRLPEDGGVTDGIADVLRAELEETQTQLQAALARNALLSPLEKGYISLNSP